MPQGPCVGLDASFEQHACAADLQIRTQTLSLFLVHSCNSGAQRCWSVKAGGLRLTAMLCHKLLYTNKVLLGLNTVLHVLLLYKHALADLISLRMATA